MLEKLSRLIDRLSEFFAARKGLLPIIGIILVTINGIFRFLPSNFLNRTDLLLHIGIILSIIGFLLAWAL